METHTKLFLLVILVFGALAFVPNLKENIGNTITTSIGPGLADTAGGIESMLSTSPIWQAYGHWLAAAAGGLFVGSLFYFRAKITGGLKSTKQKVEKPYQREPSVVLIPPATSGTSISDSTNPKNVTAEKESK